MKTRYLTTLFVRKFQMIEFTWGVLASVVLGAGWAFLMPLMPGVPTTGCLMKPFLKDASLGMA